MLWPDDPPERARHSLSMSLSSLRNQLEPPGVPQGAVIIADRFSVRLNPDAVSTDTIEFEAALKLAKAAQQEAARTASLRRALELYRGELLSGYFEDWIGPEQQRLSDLHLGALVGLTASLEKEGDVEGALDSALRAARTDPLREEAHLLLMRLYARAGNVAAGLREYRLLEKTLREELGESPSGAATAFARQLQQQVPAAVSPSIVVPVRARPSRKRPAPAEKVAESGVPVAATPCLPVQLTRLFGREQELEQLAGLLGRERLITLTGTGGSGKTRLAVEAARRATGSFGEHLWFVPLAEVTDANRIPGAIADTLGLTRAPGVPPIEQVVAFLVGLRSLLVLDNLEQVAVEGAEVIRSLLGRAPTLTCLLTSRQRLNISGEWEFAVLPLATPTQLQAPERLMQFPSVQLFVDRAQSVRPDFQLTRTNAQAVAELCEGLEGLPLAIELAASRAQVLSPARMRALLPRRFDLLTSRRRDLPERHRSLRAAMEWSYRLLSPELKAFYARLSVFRGGWTLEAAESVCEEPVALDYLAQLVESSLVVSQERGEEMRFRMLETIREFAAEHLGEPERSRSHQRHVAFFLSMAEHATAVVGTAEEIACLDRMAGEHNNLLAALSLAENTGDETCLRLAVALRRFWEVRNHYQEGRGWLAKALEKGRGASPVLRAKALGAAGTLAWHQGEVDQAQRLHEDSLALFRKAGDEAGVSVALGNLGLAAWKRGDLATARTRFEECLPLFQKRGNAKGVASTLNNLGIVSREMGDMDAARRYYRECLTMRRESGNKHGAASALINLGNLEIAQGDCEAGARLHGEGLQIFRELEDRRGIAAAQFGLGLSAFGRGETEAARQYYTESLSLRAAIQSKTDIADSLEGFGELAAREGRFAKSARLFGAATALRELIGTPVPRDDVERHVEMQDSLRRSLDEDVYVAAFEAGRRLSWDQAVKLALDSSLDTPAL